MSDKNNQSYAEFADGLLNRVALGVFLISAAYASAVLAFFVSEEVAFGLHKLKLGLGLLAVAIVLPQMVKLAKLRKKVLQSSCEPEGFVTDVYKRAAEKGFSLTFIFLLFMDFMTKRYFAELPAELLIKIIISASLAIFSLSFFFLMRQGDYGDDDDAFETERGP